MRFIAWRANAEWRRFPDDAIWRRRFPSAVYKLMKNLNLSESRSSVPVPVKRTIAVRATVRPATYKLERKRPCRFSLAFFARLHLSLHTYSLQHRIASSIERGDRTRRRTRTVHRHTATVYGATSMPHSSPHPRAHHPAPARPIALHLPVLAQFLRDRTCSTTINTTTTTGTSSPPPTIIHHSGPYEIV